MKIIINHNKLLLNCYLIIARETNYAHQVIMTIDDIEFFWCTHQQMQYGSALTMPTHANDTTNQSEQICTQW